MYMGPHITHAHVAWLFRPILSQLIHLTIFIWRHFNSYRNQGTFPLWLFSKLTLKKEKAGDFFLTFSLYHNSSFSLTSGNKFQFRRNSEVGFVGQTDELGDIIRHFISPSSLGRLCDLWPQIGLALFAQEGGKRECYWGATPSPIVDSDGVWEKCVYHQVVQFS